MPPCYLSNRIYHKTDTVTDFIYETANKVENEESDEKQEVMYRR